MRKISLFLSVLFLCVGFNVNAAVRTQQSTARQSETSARQSAVTRKTTETKTVKKNISNTGRSATNKKTVISRSATTTNRKVSTARVATTPIKQKQVRAAATRKTVAFGDKYNSCRDAYFSCMDQFCATQNETYRRCVCSSKLKNVQELEKKLAQATDNLKDFQDINIDAISKTSAEVKAMGSASEGEKAIKKDTSSSATALKNISSVLSDTKKKATQQPVSTNTNAIWGTTDLIGGADIANLTGEALYNAVHVQCAEIVTENCSDSDLKMVSSAYGVYIENDCATLESALNSKKFATNSSIRSTRHKMQEARLENYDAHNSLSLIDCIAKVREDLTQETACGKDYVHCLDVTGKYLNTSTGEPIYSEEFYQLANQLSVSGDVLNNNTNSLVINVLNQKRSFAEKSLDLCKDVSDNVWDEFLRQSVVEIYQGQQKRIQDVKSECLKVVNECYLKKTEQLKGFSDNSSEISLGTTLELSEDMCKEKLTTCSNLYGGGTEGLEILVKTMKGITDETIAQSCPDLLETFIQKTCAVSSNDSLHTFPYGCRAYAPGDQRYAQNAICNLSTINPFDRSTILITKTTDSNENSYIKTNSDKTCKDLTKRYKSCNFNYYLYNERNCDDIQYTHNYCYSVISATSCHVCPTGQLCPGGTQPPLKGKDSDLYYSCGEYYIGSLYHQLVRYALQNCTRPSNSTGVLSESLLGDVDNAMKTVQAKIVATLLKECEDKNGVWVETPWIDTDLNGYHDRTKDVLLESFYSATGANKLWGYCKPAE